MDVARFSRDAGMFVRAELLFDEISAELASILPGADIQHVGSTAVPGSLTKGDLDIVVRVTREAFPDAEKAISARFERNAGSDCADGFSAFMDSSTDPEIGVQLVAIGSACDDFLVWRDLLRANGVVRRQYDELKESYNGKSMDAYRDAKGKFIRAQLDLALTEIR
jgi:GrpB-like predicted nucleotidyltransferase (UPF0157 family)